VVALSAISHLVFSCVTGLRVCEERAVAQPIYLSRKGLEKLRAELEHLRTVGRRTVAERIQQSRERGGTVSNAEYEEAKNEMAFTEGRILTLDNLVNSALIIEESHGARETVEVGAKVTVQHQNGKTYQYSITGSAEADPSKGMISNISPIGKGLLGKRVGEVTEVSAPAGKIKLEVIAIE
jgi:transcription elongation factor GreA